MIDKESDNTITIAGIRGNKDPNPQYPKMTVNSFHENDASGTYRESEGEPDIIKYTIDDVDFDADALFITVKVTDTNVTEGMVVTGYAIPEDTEVIQVTEDTDANETTIMLSRETLAAGNKVDLTFSTAERRGNKNMFELTTGSTIRDMDDENNACKVTFTLHSDMWEVKSGREQVHVVVDEKVRYNDYDDLEYIIYNEVEANGTNFGTRMTTCPLPGHTYIVRWGTRRTSTTSPGAPPSGSPTSWRARTMESEASRRATRSRRSSSTLN